MSDYEIQEIRRIRHEISAKNNHETKRVAEYYRQIEKESKKTKRYNFVEDIQVQLDQETTSHVIP